MRKTWLMAMLCVGVVGCHNHGLPNLDKFPDGGAGDMGADMSIDMSVDDMSIGDIGIPDDALKIVTFTMFAADFANAYCTHLMTCGRLDAAQFDLCVESYNFPKGWDIDSEIMKNRLQINELQCLAAVQASRCDHSDDSYWISRCQSFYNIPHQSNGAPCLGNEECMSGYCQHALTDAGTSQQNPGCPGMCAQPDPAGTPCIIPDKCGPNAYCDTTTTHQCQRLPAVDQTCDPGIGCQIGLLCPRFAAAPRCQVPATQTSVGGACEPIQGAVTDMPSCSASMYCQLQYDSPTPPAKPNVIGATCQPKIAKNMACDPDPSRPNVGIYSFTQNQCEDGTLCYSTNGASPTCQSYGGSNDACEPGTCKAGLYCDLPNAAPSGTCRPLIADGQGCAPATYSCASTQALSYQESCIAANPDAGTNTTCGAPKGFGKSCIPGYEDTLCAPASNAAGSAYCAPTTGGKGVCAPKCQ
jgi:hypothetical protein